MAYKTTLIVSTVVLSAAFARAEVMVDGVVRDVATGEVLPRANIEVVDEGWGTISDEKGSFRVEVEALPVTLRATHVGYAEEVARVVRDAAVEIYLQPIALEIEGLTIDYDDPAVRIMREVIRRKGEWAGLVENYRVEAQTRQVLYGNQYIAGIRESLVELYYRSEADTARGAGLREQVKSRVQTANVAGALAVFPAAQYLFNLYDDTMDLHGQVLMGPTHPQALERYYFQLIEQRGDLLYIAMRPRDSERAGWTGSLTVKDREYALVEAQLKPNRRLHPAGLLTEHGLGYRFGQRFARVEPGVWLPVETEYEIEGRLGTTAAGEQVNRVRRAATPRALLKGWTAFREYEVNEPRVKYAFDVERELLVEPPSPTWDKIFARRRDETPLGRDAQRAYAELEREGAPAVWPGVAGLFLLHELKPVEHVPVTIREDPLAEGTLIDDAALRAFAAYATGIELDTTLSVLGHRVVGVPPALRGKFTSELWANRVDALHLGWRWRGDTLRGRRLGLYLKGGYNTGPGRFFSGVGLRRAWGEEGRGFAGAYFQRGTVARYPSSFYNLADNSLPFLLTLDDYFDFYWRTRWRAETGYRFTERHSALTLGINRDRDRSLDKETDFAPLCDYSPEHGHLYRRFCANRDLIYRDNPPIRAGDLASVDLALDLGGLDPKARRRVQLKAEYGDEWMGGFARFGRIDAELDAHVELRRGGLWPMESNYRLVGGAGFGDLPPQRHGTLDVGLLAFTSFGAFRTLLNRPYTGRHYAALFWEQRWRSGLFERLGLGRRAQRWGLGWVLHGAAGRTWVTDEDRQRAGFAARGADGLHRELGLSLTVLDNFNVDYTRRLDKKGWQWGLSVRKSF